jgi:hypothetical protein
MRRLVLILIVLSVASAAHAQVISSTLSGLIPAPFYGANNSVIDHNGNLLVFDVLYSSSMLIGPVAASTMKTRVTVVSPDGTAQPPVEYPGTVQVIGAGWYAVYAILYTYPGASAASTTTRSLVAFNVIDGVPLSPLPSIPAPTQAAVELSPARDNTAPDLISFVDPRSNSLILTPMAGATAPITPRYAQIIKYAGGASFVPGPRVPLP